MNEADDMLGDVQSELRWLERRISALEDAARDRDEEIRSLERKYDREVFEIKNPGQTYWGDK